MSRSGREMHLAARPEGWPTVESLRLVEAGLLGPAEVGSPSANAYLRGRMNDVKSSIAPFRAGGAMDGGRTYR